MKIIFVSLCAALAASFAQTPAPKPPAPKPLAPKPAVAPVAAAPVAAESVAPDAVVLTIGDEKITRAQYETFLMALPEQARGQATGANKRGFAEQLVEMKTFAAEARRRKLDQTPEARERVKLQIDNMAASELLRSMDASMKPNDAAITAYYDQNKSEFEEVKASHILIRFQGSGVPVREGQKEMTPEESLAKAKSVRERLVKGEDFAVVAKAESDDAGSGAQGGSLGTFGRRQMVPEFEQAAFSLPIGQISEPVKSQFGYHIIKVESRGAKPLDQVRQQVETKLKTDTMRKAVDELKKSTPTNINEAYFPK